MDSRQYFLLQPAPDNYVAGLGRGATGFTTRSDLGPSREGPSDEQMKAAVAKRTAQLGLSGANGDDKGDDDAKYNDPENESSLFQGGIYTKDDAEADAIWDAVDAKMAKRHKKQREAKEKAEREKDQSRDPTIKETFAPYKRALAEVTAEEWANLPEARDTTGRAKRARQERLQRSYRVPDSVLTAGRPEFGTTVADDDAGTASANTDGTWTDFNKVGEARMKVFKSKLDQAAQNLGTASSLPTGGSVSTMKNAAESVGDVEQLRKMLRSAIDSNPKQASSWIAAARLENQSGKLGAARKLIAQGCQHCPKSEDIWLENIHLNSVQNAKVIAAEAVRNKPHSVKLWVEGMKLADDLGSKKRWMRQAVTYNQESEALWKELVNLEEDPADACLLLRRATQLVPASIDLWVALARHEQPGEAKKVLNKALKANPTSFELWISAARLEENLGTALQTSIMKKAVTWLEQRDSMPAREVWIAEAEKCEADGAPVTSRNIIDATLGWGLDKSDNLEQMWVEDAMASLRRGKVATARAILAYALSVFANSENVYMKAINLERNHGSKSELRQILEAAVKACPKSSPFWLMLAKENAGDFEKARSILRDACDQVPKNENLWFAAAELEAENSTIEEARELLQTARQHASTDRVWVRSVNFERQHGDHERANDLLLEAIQSFPTSPKLRMMKGQVSEAMGQEVEARAAYSAGVKAVPSSAPLWMLYSRFEEANGNVVKARSILDRARQAIPKSPELWRELVRVERRVGDLEQAKMVMASALQLMPTSGLLWAEHIMHLVPRTQRKSVLTEAIKKVGDDPILLVTAARLLWKERKLVKALNWFQRALEANPDIGDTWAWFYKFLEQHGTDTLRADTIAKCLEHNPRYGELWQPIAKDPKHAGKNSEEILKLVVATLEV
jgi:pre-mRNA-processing factor 6